MEEAKEVHKCLRSAAGVFPHVKVHKPSLHYCQHVTGWLVLFCIEWDVHSFFYLVPADCIDFQYYRIQHNEQTV